MGRAIARVEVQVDDGSWTAARLRRRPHGKPRGRADFAWDFWTFDWGTPVPGEHGIRSRAFDVNGNVQPAPDDPYLASRRTYWENNGQIQRRVLVA